MNIKIAIGVPVLNQEELTQNFLNKLRETEGSQLFPLIIVDNGSKTPVRDYLKGLRETRNGADLVIRNGENFGVLKALNQIWTVAGGTFDYIMYLHNDVLIHEHGWDDKIAKILLETQSIGVAGFYGAKGIGTADIYRAPYQQQQMVRVENVSNCMRMNPAIHGFRPIKGNGVYEDVAVLDGFSLIVATKLLSATNGFDRSFPPHHMYDNDICLESIDKGYRNIVISMDAEHLGGRTDVAEDWNKPFGKEKHEIHTDAHPIFYNKWSRENHDKGVHSIYLPIRRG